MKTQYTKPAEIKKNWYVVDASGQTLGRMASQIAHVLMGKHKASFVRNWDCGDHVVVLNAGDVALTGRKREQKKYYWHTSYIGGIKEVGVDELRETYPDRVIKSAVKGMLPKNKLGRKMLGHLKIYAGAEHPHEAQKPAPLPKRTI